MTSAAKHGRLDVLLVRVGFVCVGLSVAGWLAARYVPSIPQLAFQVSASLFIAALVLIFAVALLVQADLRRAVATLREGAARAGAGLHVSSDSSGLASESAPLPGVYSRWSESVDRLVSLVADYSRLVTALIEEIPYGVVLLTRDSRVRAANRAFFRMFGMDRQEVNGSALQQILPESLAELWPPSAVSAANWYGADARELRDAASGRIFRSSLVQLPEGRELTGLVALVVEEVDPLPEPKKPGPPEFRELYRPILDACPAPLMAVGSDGSIWEINAAALNLLGYGREQALDLSLGRLLAPSPEETKEQRLDTVLASGEWRLDGKALDASFLKQSGASFRAEVRLREWSFERTALRLLLIRDVSEERLSNQLASEKAEALEMMSTGQPQEAVYARLTQFVERQLPNSVCVVLLRRGNQLFPSPTPNISRGLLRAHVGLALNSNDAPYTTAAVSEFVAAPDLGAHPMRGDLRCAVAEELLQSCWSMPILSGEGLLQGAVAVYRKTSGEPDQGQAGVVKMVARLASLCLEQQGFAEKLALRAHHDPLTGLPKRGPFENWLKRALANAKRHSRTLGVISVEMDGISPVNGALGPEAEEKILQGVAPRLREAVRETDIVARWSGGEFKVGLMEVSHKADALLVANRLQESLEKPVEIDGQAVTVKPAVGVSLYPDDGQDPETLLETAALAAHLPPKEPQQAVCRAPEPVRQFLQ